MAAEAKPISKTKRGKRQHPWVLARKITQYLGLIIFLWLLVMGYNGVLPGDVANLLMRLDPLAFLANLLAGKAVVSGALLSLLTIGLTLVFGRAWCGWLCPLGTTLDLFSTKQKKKEQKSPSENWRKVKYAFLILILAAAVFGNLTLMILDPLTIMIRSFTVGILPALDRAVTAAEILLVDVPFMADAVVGFDTWIRSWLLPAKPIYFQGAVMMVTVLAGVVALNLAAPRFWCRYLCPLGGLLGLLSKLAIFKRQVGDGCINCGLCDAKCPTGTIDPERGYASDPAECTMCMNCLESCPRSSINFNPGLAKAAWREYDPARRDLLAGIGATVAGVALLKSESIAFREHPFLLRPPGGRENDLMSKCVRCGQCIRVCPTGALQPAGFEAGIEGMWTPILVPRLGQCDFSCTLCGQTCPVEAIPLLDLPTKQQQVIGKAYIDELRCIAWADHTDCLVCEEMCPLPDKAIKLEPREMVLWDGSVVTVEVPHVLRDVCIGCGSCENKCPVNGTAAIQVFVPPALKGF